MKPDRKSTSGAAALTFLIFATANLYAQLSLQSAVDIALKNSPRIKVARADLDKANAARAESRDAYVPVVTTEGGYGTSTGAPLGVPVVFSISAQSLLFSFSQQDYVRSARQSFLAAQHILQKEQIEVVEDTTNTYIALDSALERRKVVREELEYANRLIQVVSERIDAGIDAKVELPKAKRTATQFQLVALNLEDEILADSSHLATLTGMPAATMRTDHATIPALKPPTPTASATQDVVADSEAIQAAAAGARAKQYAAFGDRRYLFRPRVTFSANYSRVSTSSTSYLDYYPRFEGTAAHPNSNNSLSIGFQIVVPLLDMAQRAKARQSSADATHAFAEVELNRGIYREGRAKLQHAALELQLKADLAREDQEIARDQLEALQVQLQANASGLQTSQLTPKDLLNAQLQERQRQLDLLLAEMQLRQTQINLLRQTDTLSTWVISSDRTPAGTSPNPGTPYSLPATNLPGTPGVGPTNTVPSTPVVPTPALPKP